MCARAFIKILFRKAQAKAIPFSHQVGGRVCFFLCILENLDFEQFSNHAKYKMKVMTLAAQITPNSYEEIKIPINIKEIEPVMTLAAYHYSKYLGLPTLKPLVLKEGKIRENFIVFYWGKVKMCVVLVVGKKATCYILENGSFVEVEVQTISKGQIQVVGGIFNDKEAKIQGFEIQVEGKSAYSIE
ncbi:Hypothetical_protein [Hexamita inflata]|uniref:Hypothetical_protein n=1 Tax=Hexamita inflata TaxID=28002 RepID=A0AA86TUV1_9EUKA|nr:Hypothetical protein HINF_LOCUS15632 [Hexamita inflata]